MKDDRKSIITDEPSLVVMFKKEKKERKCSSVLWKVAIESENMFSFGQAGRKEKLLLLHSEQIFANS